MKRCFGLLLLALVAMVAGAQAEGPDDQYVRIYNLLQEAESLENGAGPAQALAKYLEAQTALERFQKGFPDWNPKVVGFRWSLVTNKVAVLSPKASAAGANRLAAGNPAAGANPAQPEQEPSHLALQLAALNEQVRQLQSDKLLMQAKLKEAFAVQPAAVDPRQLAQAQQQVKSLQKENDLLKTTLTEEKAKRAPGAAEVKAATDTRQALEEANRKLAEQTRRADALSQEKQYLQNKLSVLATNSENSAALETTRKALSDANRQLLQQKDLASRLATEKEALESRLKTSGADSEAAAALRAENALLKKQLAEATTAQAASKNPGDLAPQLAQARAQLAVLQSDRNLLRLENVVLENRLKQMAATPQTNVVASARPEDTQRIKELERQREALQSQLEAATKELNNRKSVASAARVTELEQEVAALRSRIETFEARRVPFNAEELAVFNRLEMKLIDAAPATGANTNRELPADTTSLVADAQRYFSARQFDKAEAAYLQVLRQDQKNVFALANLATIQLERNRLKEAEANLLQALVVAPQDVYSLSTMGYLKYRQQRYDDALDYLNRAAKLDPKNPQVQNYLGITLGEKGLRAPAETAFRKAIEIEPRYSDAHVNLAVIYVSHEPPAMELARLHYQKALTLGHARDPYLEKKLEPTR